MGIQWHLEAVPRPRLWEFTALDLPDSVDLMAPSDFLSEDDAFWRFMDLLNTAGRYPVALQCECGAVKHFEADPSEDAGQEDTCYQLEGLDRRMEPWLGEHAGCRWQLPLPLVAR